MELFEEWVYRNLKKYKNCVIANSIVESVGEEIVLTELKNHGFECKLICSIHPNESQFNSTKQLITNYIVEVDHHGTI